MTSKVTEDKVKSLIEDCFGKEKVSIKYSASNPDLWTELEKQITYLPVSYSPSFNDYQYCYHRPHGDIWGDLSVVLIWDTKIVGYWPLSHHINETGNSVLSCFGLELLPPIFISTLSLKIRKKITKSCLNVICRVAEALDISELKACELFDDTYGLSEWSQYLMQGGATREVKDELLLNIIPEFSEIKKNFGKSLKWSINTGIKLWDCNILEDDNRDVWEEFRELHKVVSGKVTRSADSWNKQFENLCKGDAFLVYLRDENNQMVGGGFFDVSKDEGLYSVAAYKRELFDKPVGHAVQYYAIEEMKKRGVKWYKLGVRPYVTDKPIPSNKEMTIAAFKQGFASHVVPKFIFNLNIKDLNNE